MINKIILALATCSVSCSFILLFWSSTIDNISLKNDRKESNVIYENVVKQDATIARFQTTFSEPALVQSRSDDAKKKDTEEVRLLKEELEYSKKMYEDLKNKQLGPNHNDCRSQKIAKCQLIHVAIVCAGYKETRRVVTLMKSILFYRKQPLHFHFVSDQPGRHVLKVLFDTWKLQKVSISFYDADQLKSEVEWIPNSHYSGVFGLMKLTLTKALPDFMDKVIVLDTDVFFLTDIAELWRLFECFNSQQAIGLVENQSEWYTGKLWKNYKHWPALGRGFNTGVMLFDLKKLRQIKWHNLWRLTAEKQLLSLLSTVLADQDVINAALKDNPLIVYKLPCEWNIQLSDNAQSATCYTDVIDLKIIHWNSPKKLGVKHKHAEYFRNMYLTFLQYDGNLLRKMISSCNTGAFEEQAAVLAVDSNLNKLQEDDLCYEFQMEQNLLRRVHLFYLDYALEKSSENDVTLLAHLSMDRLQILDSLARQWTGPMSIALYASDAEAQQFLRYSERSDILKKRRNIGIHIVYKDGDLYPVNYLRNIALKQVQTSHVFLCDIDFLPVHTLYATLKDITLTTDLHKKAIVIPAFETFQYKLKFPKTKDDLLLLWKNKTIETFRESVWLKGHAPTDFERWKSANENYKITWEPDFEPYILVQKHGLPFYDMRFVGFGWNKVSHIMELHALKYDFVVSWKTFIIHMPHAPSSDITKYRNNFQYRQCLRERKESFKDDMNHKYGIVFT